MTRIIGPPASAGPASAASAASARDPGSAPAAAFAPTGIAASSIARRSAAALCSVSSNSSSGTLRATMPAPVWTWAMPVLEHRAADRDRGVEVAVVAEVSDRTAVQASPFALRGGDQLHRPDLGGAGQRAGREHGPQRVERVEVRPQLRLDVAHQVEDVAVPLDLHVLAGGHGARPGHPAEVVASEVHEHHVLGTLLGIAAQLVGQAVVLRRRRAARTGARDRVGGHPVADHLEQQLRARAHDLERRACA